MSRMVTISSCLSVGFIIGLFYSYMKINPYVEQLSVCDEIVEEYKLIIKENKMTDKLYQHEALDRAYIAHENFCSNVLEHQHIKENEHLLKMAEDIAAKTYDLYNSI